MTKTKEQLEIEELPSLLTEMEDALRAIRNGEFDAIMISGENVEQVYSVTSAETPYLTFMEKMSEEAVTLIKDGMHISNFMFFHIFLSTSPPAPK